MPDTEEGRITLAILQRDILHLTELIKLYLENSKKHDGDIKKLDERLTCIEPTVKTTSRIMEIALYVIVIAVIGGVMWAVIQSGSFLP